LLPTIKKTRIKVKWTYSIFYFLFSVASRKPSQKNMVLNVAENPADGNRKSFKIQFWNTIHVHNRSFQLLLHLWLAIMSKNIWVIVLHGMLKCLSFTLLHTFFHTYWPRFLPKKMGTFNFFKSMTFRHTISVNNKIEMNLFGQSCFQIQFNYSVDNQIQYLLS
jgi:hypothetical protein